MRFSDTLQEFSMSRPDARRRAVFASEGAAFIAGQILTVDGGKTAG
jgi:hypothetical protein